MRVAILSLEGLFAEVTDADSNGFISAGDRVTVELTSEEGRVRAEHEVYEESLATSSHLAKYLTALSGRQVNVLDASNGSAYIAYSSANDRGVLAGIADGKTGKTYDFDKMDKRYVAPDYAKELPRYKRVEQTHCYERNVDQDLSACLEKVAGNYQTLLRLAQDYDVALTALQDRQSALSQMFVGAELSVAAFQDFVVAADAVETSWSKYISYEL